MRHPQPLLPVPPPLDPLLPEGSLPPAPPKPPLLLLDETSPLDELAEPLLLLLDPLSGVHLPLMHVPPEQGVPSGLFGVEQIPVDGLQVPTSWHSSLALQTTGVPLVQTPPWQVSLSVQASPSEQAEPSAFAGLSHAPVVGSQVPAVWH